MQKDFIKLTTEINLKADLSCSISNHKLELHSNFVSNSDIRRFHEEIHWITNQTTNFVIIGWRVKLWNHFSMPYIPKLLIQNQTLNHWLEPGIAKTFHQSWIPSSSCFITYLENRFTSSHMSVYLDPWVSASSTVDRVTLHFITPSLMLIMEWWRFYWRWGRQIPIY